MWLKWRIMLGLGILPPVVIVISLTFLPESPRWLISRGRIREGYQVIASSLCDTVVGRCKKTSMKSKRKTIYPFEKIPQSKGKCLKA